MSVSAVPSAERLRASSLLDEKLVTIWLVGSVNVPTLPPDGVISASVMGDVTPKLLSTLSLLNTPGYVPSAAAAPPLGSAWPTVTVEAVPV